MLFGQFLMGKPSNQKYAKNKEILVICGSDKDKTNFLSSKPHAEAQGIYRNKAYHECL